MSSGGNISDRLAGAAVPLCVWGMISALVLHLIDVRAVFIQGGEVKLRQATLAFAAGVILIQRLSVLHGPSTARAYVWTMGASIGLFAAYHAASFRTGIHPAIVFVSNVALYGLLWWVAHRITAACSVDSEDAVERAASSGILTAGAPMKKRKWKLKLHAVDTGKGTAVFEPKWEEKPPARHPGRIILWFSALALPMFAVGPFIYPAGGVARIQLGVWFFIYLWCALALLSLASLRQLAVYFEQRGVTLPDLVGLTWMAMGVAAITFALILAWLLPQPPTAGRLYVRDRIVATYHGWESKYGYKDPSAGKRDNRTERQKVEDRIAERNRKIDAQGNDPGITSYLRESNVSDDDVERNIADMRDGIAKFFAKAIPFIIFLALGCALFVLLFVVMVMLKRGLAGAAEWGRKQSDRRAQRKERRERAVAAAPAFSAFGDPFAPGAPARDAAAIVRHMWAATMAWCAQMGAPCPAERTALEYIDGRPDPLTGFEERARFLADWLAFAEFSGQPVPEDLRPELQDYWSALARHVRQA